MVHAFNYNAPMLKRICREMVTRAHRDSIGHLAKLGAVGVILESLVSTPYDEDLVEAGMTLVGRASLHSDNQEALSTYSGVQAVLSVMQGYRQHPFGSTMLHLHTT